MPTKSTPLQNFTFAPSKPHLNSPRLRLKPSRAIHALDRILHLTMADDDVSPLPLPHISHSPSGPLYVNRTDLALTQAQGASPRELLLEACRRNNTNLLSELLARFPTPEKIAHLLNTATDGLGNYCLHVAAAHGSCRLCPCADTKFIALCSSD